MCAERHGKERDGRTPRLVRSGLDRLRHRCRPSPASDGLCLTSRGRAGGESLFSPGPSASKRETGYVRETARVPTPAIARLALGPIEPQPTPRVLSTWCGSPASAASIRATSWAGLSRGTPRKITPLQRPARHSRPAEQQSRSEIYTASRHTTATRARTESRPPARHN